MPLVLLLRSNKHKINYVVFNDTLSNLHGYSVFDTLNSSGCLASTITSICG